MRSHRELRILLAASLLGPAAARAGGYGPPLPEPPASMPLGVLAGAQARSDLDIDSARFEEFGEVREGAYLGAARLMWEEPDHRRGAELRVRDAGQAGEAYRLGFHLAPGAAFALWYSRTPHLFSRRTRSLLAPAGGDHLAVADPIQEALEALDNVTSGASGTAAPGIPVLVGDLVSGLPVRSLGYRRRQGGGSASFRLTPHWSARVDFLREQRDGTRVLSAGSYERTALGSGAAHTADLFRPLLLEMAVPVDDATTRLTVATDFSVDRFVAELALKLDRYRAGIESLSFDNPFRITDFASSSFRQRFARGILDLAPDNDADELSVSAAVDLPGKSRLHGSFSTARWRQDDAFAPWSLNAAISKAAGLDVTDAASLPARSLDGEVRINAGSLSFSTRPGGRFRLDARLRYYDWNNDSAEIEFPGYAAYSESAWRTSIEGRKVANHLQDYTRLAFGVEGSVRPARGFTLAARYDREDWDRTGRSVEGTVEDSFGLSAEYRPNARATLRARWRHAKRDFDGAYDGGLEYQNLRTFDLARRSRDELRLLARFVAGEELTLGGNLAAVLDDYDESPYGLAESRRWEGGIDASWSRSEQFVLSGFYARESLGQLMRSNAKDDRVGGTNFLPANDWSDDIDDSVDVIGLDLSGLAAERWDWSARWSTTLGRTGFAAVNPNGTPKLTNAIAYPWPDIDSDLHVIDLRLGYRTSGPWRFGLAYRYEKFDLDDFTMDLVEPYVHAATSATPNDNRRVLFLDQTYGSYEIHSGGLFAGYSF